MRGRCPACHGGGWTGAATCMRAGRYSVDTCRLFSDVAVAQKPFESRAAPLSRHSFLYMLHLERDCVNSSQLLVSDTLNFLVSITSPACLADEQRQPAAFPSFVSLL